MNDPQDLHTPAQVPNMHVTTIPNDQHDRYHAGKSYFRQWLDREDTQLALDELRPGGKLLGSYAMYACAYLAGAAFQEGTPVRMLAVCAGESTAAIDAALARNPIAPVNTLIDWIRNGHHSSLLLTELYPKRSANLALAEPGDPDFTESVAEHELFAIFRAGARFAATGSAFRQSDGWSIPGAGRSA
jgi:hypothetical protein